MHILVQYVKLLITRKYYFKVKDIYRSLASMVVCKLNVVGATRDVVVVISQLSLGQWGV